MASIKILSWNVEHFKQDKAEKVMEIIEPYDPDIIALYEVEKSIIYNEFLKEFKKYSYFLTTGQQSQEILIAVKNRFEGIKFEQREKFKSGNPYLRPGVFLTLKYPKKNQYGFLFLHTKSGPLADAFGMRIEMLRHAFNLKRKVDFVENRETNFMIMGDLNTMGMEYPKKNIDVFETEDELKYIDYQCQNKSDDARSSREYKARNPKMRRLTKPSGTYYSSSIGISDLDHIIASDHLKFVGKRNYGETGYKEVRLDGWREHLGDPAEMKKYANEISDHCLLFCELKVV